MKEQAQQMYESYREVFAKRYGYTIEFATRCQLVKEYKKYLEDKHDVKINDEVSEDEKGKYE